MPSRTLHPKRPSRRLGRSIVLATLALSALAGGTSAHQDRKDPLQVRTATGWLQGTEGHGGLAWLGIPYAQPPVGELRWQAPRPARPWAGVRSANAFGAHCPQPDTAPLQYGFPGGQEDCLFLNVYAPKARRGHELRPVLVWIHGGAFFLGRSNNYLPDRFVERDVVVVTLNYRLGALGLLAHPALNDAEGRSGNYALADQQLALKWVQQNIAAFGGDPRRVTLAGQSAGGASVLSHVASPQARGLFRAAIVQSGAYLPLQPTGAQAQAIGTVTAATLGCPNDANAAACLRALPVETIVAKQPAGASYAPNVDGRLLTQTTNAAFAAGRFNRVPLLTGSTHDEYTAFVGQTELATRAPLPAVAYPIALQSATANTALTPAQALALYPLADFGGNASLALSAVVTDNLFACNGRRVAQQLAARVPVYAYEFNDANAPMTLQPPVSFPYKASHSTDIQYLFSVAGSSLDGAQQALSDRMVGYWTRFISSGSPNLWWRGRDPRWPRYGSEGEQDRYLQFAPAGDRVTTNFSVDHKCADWLPAS